MQKFDHEKLNVYTVSLAFVRFVHELSSEIQPVHRNARDQLIRAAQSIPLNIAEGNAKVPGRDRTRFWEIARGSAMESAAALDILVVCDACTGVRTSAGRDLLFRIVSMLSRMTVTRLDSAKEDTTEYNCADLTLAEHQSHDREYEEENEDDKPKSRAIGGTNPCP